MPVPPGVIFHKLRAAQCVSFRVFAQQPLTVHHQSGPILEIRVRRPSVMRYRTPCHDLHESTFRCSVPGIEHTFHSWQSYQRLRVCQTVQDAADEFNSRCGERLVQPLKGNMSGCRGQTVYQVRKLGFHRGNAKIPFPKDHILKATSWFGLMVSACLADRRIIDKDVDLHSNAGTDHTPLRKRRYESCLGSRSQVVQLWTGTMRRRYSASLILLMMLLELM